MRASVRKRYRFDGWKESRVEGVVMAIDLMMVERVCSSCREWTWIVHELEGVSAELIIQELLGLMARWNDFK